MPRADLVAFFRVWLSGYRSPSHVIEGLRGRPAPQWGFYAQLTRAVLDSLLLYVPLALMGREPSTHPYVTFLSADRCYAASALFMPIFLLLHWLLLCALVHLMLRLAGRRSQIDLIMNVTGMTALVVGAFLLVWDWAYVLLGFRDPVILGVSHLIFDVWGIAITVVGFKRLLGVPVWLGIVLNGVWLAVGVPLAMIFVRGPVQAQAGGVNSTPVDCSERLSSRRSKWRCQGRAIGVRAAANGSYQHPNRRLSDRLWWSPNLET